jgi:hypothetical protein
MSLLGQFRLSHIAKGLKARFELNPIHGLSFETFN